LAENNRLSVLEGVVEKFGLLMGAYRGEVELTVTSAAVGLSVLLPREKRFEI
jgi:F-type H+-transporting ATPase subunit O